MFNLQNPFPGKERNEAAYIFARPYFIAFLPTAAIFIFIYCISLFFQLAVSQNWIGGFTNDIANAIILFVGLFQLFILIVFLVAILDFYYDIIIVTDRRMVDVDQEQLFFRSISELNLEDIEDVNSSVSGFMQTIFGYGTITVQTAGEQENFVAKNFRNPHEIASIISDLSEQAKQAIPQAERIPRTSIIGVINDRLINSMQGLQDLGAINSDDTRKIS